jgi:hypothetical protein
MVFKKAGPNCENPIQKSLTRPKTNQPTFSVHNTLEDVLRTKEEVELLHVLAEIEFSSRFE